MKSSVVRTDDPRFQRSLGALNAAILELVEARPLAELSITRIVQAAGVTRPTFYQHFTDILDAARKVMLSRLDAAFPMPEPLPEHFDFSRQSFVERIVSDALPVIRHLAEHRTFYLRVLDGAGNAAFFEEIIAFLSSRMLPEPFDPAVHRGSAKREDIMAAMAGGIMWMVIGWLRHEAGVQPEEMAHRIAAVIVAMIAPPTDVSK